MRPESYEELTTYLNGLSTATWKAIKFCHHIGGDERVIRYLRQECGNDLALFDHEELAEYLETHDLFKDFLPVGDRP